MHRGPLRFGAKLRNCFGQASCYTQNCRNVPAPISDILSDGTPLLPADTVT
jgi:hypothetical protein